MIAVLALLLASSAVPGATLADARKALDAGRTQQARLMVDAAVARGEGGPFVDRLLADIAFVSGNDSEAEARYATLALANPAIALFAERSGIAALRSGDTQNATRLMSAASKFQYASWRVWNALGVGCDRAHDWKGADAAYSRALEISPDEATILNNRGWSQMLQGHLTKAAALLERAAIKSPTTARIRDNLELVRSAIARDLPAPRSRESDEQWAARLNDAGVAALLLNDRPRAIAAFTRAITARGSWYRRAANNLALAETAP